MSKWFSISVTLALLFGFLAKGVYAFEYPLEDHIQSAFFNKQGDLVTVTDDLNLKAWVLHAGSWQRGPIQFVELKPGQKYYNLNINYGQTGWVGVESFKLNRGDRLHDFNPDGMEMIIQDENGVFSLLDYRDSIRRVPLISPRGAMLVDARVSRTLQLTLHDRKQSYLRSAFIQSTENPVENSELAYALAGEWNFRWEPSGKILSQGDDSIMMSNNIQGSEAQILWTSDKISQSLRLLGREVTQLEWLGDATNLHFFKAMSGTSGLLIAWDANKENAVIIAEEPNAEILFCAFDDLSGGHANLYYAVPGSETIKMLTRSDIESGNFQPRQFHLGFQLEKDSKIQLVDYSPFLMVVSGNQVKVWTTRFATLLEPGKVGVLGAVKSIKTRYPVLDAVVLPTYDNTLLAIDRGGVLAVEELVSSNVQ